MDEEDEQYPHKQKKMNNIIISRIQSVKNSIRNDFYQEVRNTFQS